MKYFDISEFACPCCGEHPMNEHLLEMLDEARYTSGVPFVITSGYRCKAHNEKVGGKTNSAHTTGHAVDISAESSGRRFRIAHALHSAGFKRIGISRSPGFIHVDNDPDKPQQVLWLY